MIFVVGPCVAESLPKVRQSSMSPATWLIGPVVLLSAPFFTLAPFLNRFTITPKTDQVLLKAKCFYFQMEMVERDQLLIRLIII